jgi:AraC-like DNA-binding protein
MARGGHASRPAESAARYRTIATHAIAQSVDPLAYCHLLQARNCPSFTYGRLHGIVCSSTAFTHQLLRWPIDHPQQVGITSGLIMGLTDPRLAKALIALHRSSAEDWSLPRMAAEAGMSRSAFAASFKEATGTTPAEYLSDWRLTLATSQIRSGRHVKSIAAELGYASASSLSKAFKQRFGSSPREWAQGHPTLGH